MGQMSNLFIVNVVTMYDGKLVPLPGATVACYVPHVLERVDMDLDGRAAIAVPCHVDLVDGTNIILRVRKFGYLPVEEVVRYERPMEEIQIALLPDKIYCVNDILMKVKNSFVGLKDLLI
jgi:hypothetical protein